MHAPSQRPIPRALLGILLAFLASACGGSVARPTDDTPPCGNGRLDADEQCDDGNVAAGDGCAACVVENGWTCAGAPSACSLPCADDAVCNDGNPCTDDDCTSAGTCAWVANTVPCDDGVFCNGVDTCGGGSCGHAGDPCTGGASCASTCNETADNCFAAAGQPCTDDGNPCTDNQCDGTGECLTTNNAATCDDGVFCNGVEQCSAGSCEHSGDPCAAGGECADTCDENDDDCFANEGDPCTDDGNLCTDNLCDAAGTCAPVFNTAPCDDGLFCNGADACSTGSCRHAGNACSRAPTSSSSYACYEPQDACAWPAFARIVAGLAHACGLTASGTINCWGDNSSGQLGAGANAGPFSETPLALSAVNLAPNTTFIDVACGDAHTCALAADGTAYCWGDDASGQLGNGATTTTPQYAPVAVSLTPVAGSKTLRRITAGAAHTCAITGERTGYCWGEDGDGQLGNGAATTDDQTSPSPIDASALGANAAILDLAAGGTHTCAITAAGVTYCWGADGGGQLGNGAASTSQPSPSSVDTAPLGGDTFVQLAASRGTHTCGLTSQGAIFCWGDDASGQLGNAAVTGPRVSPSAVDASGVSEPFVRLAVGDAHSCALTADGRAYCWGSDAATQLGNGTAVTANQTAPDEVDATVIAVEQRFGEITAGADFTCGLNVEGVAHCWGDDTYGQLGNGAATSGARAAPFAVDTSGVVVTRRFRQVAAGVSHSCGVSSDSIAYCWGFYGSGRLGIGTTTSERESPTAVSTTTVSGSPHFREVAVGHGHSCGITSDGTAYCWGSDELGELGNGAAITADQVRPAAVDTTGLAGTTTFTRITANTDHTCALTADGSAYCWGDDTYGQLGNGAALTATQTSPSPVDMTTVAGGARFVSLTAGRRHTCGVTAQGAAYCWGEDVSGQLGNGDALTVQQTSPSAVSTATVTGNAAFVQITAGGAHTCALMADGAGYCWGSDGSWQLGDGSVLTGTKTSPSPVVASSPFITLGAGVQQTCGVFASGTAVCWGNDLYGQLGNAISGQADSPSTVDVSAEFAAFRRFVSVVSGNYHSCGINSVGYAYCWGQDHDGQVGNGQSLPLSSFNVPADVVIP